jgi:hypothetical protein
MYFLYRFMAKLKSSVEIFELFLSKTTRLLVDYKLFSVEFVFIHLTVYSNLLTDEAIKKFMIAKENVWTSLANMYTNVCGTTD